MAIFLLFTPQKNLWGPSRRHLRVVGGSIWPPQNLYHMVQGALEREISLSYHKTIQKSQVRTLVFSLLIDSL